MSEAMLATQVGVYIDIDNVVISRYDELFGRGAFRDDKVGSRNPSKLAAPRLEKARINIDGLMDYASSFGAVAISRAYGNWASPVNAKYDVAMLRRSVDLVQLFPMTGTKNGADIRLAIDVIDDLGRHPGIGCVVVVAGDSDYVALAQRCRRFGRRVIGVGVRGSSGQYWQTACDEFRFYGQLPGVEEVARAKITKPMAPAVDDGDGSLPGPDLLVRALRLFASKSDSEWLNASTVKVQMKRLEPTFDETAYGCRNFTEYLRQHEALIDVRVGERGTELRPKDAAGVFIPADVSPPAAAVELDNSNEAPEVLSLRKQMGITTVLGLSGDRQRVAVVRALWAALDARGPSEFVPVDDVIQELTAGGGMSLQEARRRTWEIVHSGLSIALHTADMSLISNAEFSEFDDDTLVRVLQQWTADRARAKLLPDPVRVACVLTAVYGREQPKGAKEAMESISGWGCFDQMRRQVAASYVSAAALWDVAQVFSELPTGTPVETLVDFSDAMRDPLNELDRDPTTVSLSAAHLTLMNSNVINAGVRDETYDSADSIVDAAITTWARELTDAGLFDASEPAARECFYRLVLSDRYSAAERRWIRDLLGVD